MWAVPMAPLRRTVRLGSHLSPFQHSGSQASLEKQQVLEFVPASPGGYT